MSHPSSPHPSRLNSALRVEKKEPLVTLHESEANWSRQGTNVGLNTNIVLSVFYSLIMIFCTGEYCGGVCVSCFLVSRHISPEQHRVMSYRRAMWYDIDNVRWKGKKEKKNPQPIQPCLSHNDAALTEWEFFSLRAPREDKWQGIPSAFVGVLRFLWGGLSVTTKIQSFFTP